MSKWNSTDGAAVAEAGGMMYMDDGIEMETIFATVRSRAADFSTRSSAPGKRLLTGEIALHDRFPESRRRQKTRGSSARRIPGKSFRSTWPRSVAN